MILPLSSLHSVSASSLRAELREKRWHLRAKLAFDFIVACGLLFVLAPLFCAVAVGVRHSSPGPALFCQRRVGLGNREFWFYKFRTMRVGSAPERQTNALERAGVLYKQQNDPRVTALGRWLRRSSLDEIPQLFNILRGEMSLVGPRPLVPFMLEPYPEFKEIRALVRPGLTGLWQIRDRENNTSAQFMMPHDLEYITRFSFWRDLQILGRTVFAVTSGRGAF